MDPLLTFLQANLGHGGLGDTPVNLGQCVGLVELWLDARGLPHIWGNAADLLANADLRLYRIIKNRPNNAPGPGDILVWGPSWGGGYGHCAIVVAANVRMVAVFEQNNPAGSPAVVASYGYDGVEGWIVLPAGGATP